MVKILIIEKPEIEENKIHYKSIVKYTNKQNSINETIFGSQKNLFKTIQDGFLERGFVLEVKQSDKNKFNAQYKDKTEESKIVFKANKFINNEKIIKFKNNSDLRIPLDKLLQVLLAFNKDGYYAYTKKNFVLKPNNKEIYENFSLKINDYFTIHNMIRLYVLYIKAEKDKKASGELKSPIPYYIIGFFGFITKNNQNYIEELFMNEDLFNNFYQYLTRLSNLYKNKVKLEYNVMIKRPIENAILLEQFEVLKAIGVEKNVEDFINKINS